MRCADKGIMGCSGQGLSCPSGIRDRPKTAARSPGRSPAYYEQYAVESLQRDSRVRRPPAATLAPAGPVFRLGSRRRRIPVMPSCYRAPRSSTPHTTGRAGRNRSEMARFDHHPPGFDRGPVRSRAAAHRRRRRRLGDGDSLSWGDGRSRRHRQRPTEPDADQAQHGHKAKHPSPLGRRRDNPKL